MQLRIAGIPISDDNARDIVTTLISDGTPTGLALANRLSTCIELGTMVMTLNAGERSTLLAVLEEPPDSLAEFRGKLARDDRDPQARTESG